METIDETGLAEFVVANRGKVVLVDFWATWCGPCLKLFPHTVELHRRFAERGLVVVSVSLDEESDRESVNSVLEKQGAEFDNFIGPYGVSSTSFEAFEIPGGSIPCVKLYDREGTLRAIFPDEDDQIDADEIDRAVDELLGD